MPFLPSIERHDNEYLANYLPIFSELLSTAKPGRGLRATRKMLKAFLSDPGSLAGYNPNLGQQAAELNAAGRQAALGAAAAGLPPELASRQQDVARQQQAQNFNLQNMDWAKAFGLGLIGQNLAGEDAFRRYRLGVAEAGARAASGIPSYQQNPGLGSTLMGTLFGAASTAGSLGWRPFGNG
jgi:hypothetical protein